jgi:hypothetical protein
MDNPDDRSRPRLGPRQVARLVVPVFVASTLVMAIGLLLVVAHHRSVGLIIIVAGAVGGFLVRAWLMIRSQQGPRPLR